jgi:acyl-CoA synthetase (AMP-forming)/AMP-acid ligase II
MTEVGAIVMHEQAATMSNECRLAPCTSEESCTSTSFVPSNVLRAIEDEHITVVFLAPTMWNRLLHSQGIGGYEVSSVRLYCSGGESLSVLIIRQLIDLVGAGFTAGYELTEAAFCSTRASARARDRQGRVRRRAIPPQSRVIFR